MTREEAIEELLSMKHIFIIESDADKALDMAIEALSDVPDTNAGKLIPCSERLPEADKEVFVYIYDMPFIAWVDKNGEWNTETFTLDKELEKDDEPIAWMPLPEPYKEDNMEDNHYKMGKMLADNFYNGVSFWREYADKRWEEIYKDYKGSEDKE